MPRDRPGRFVMGEGKGMRAWRRGRGRQSQEARESGDREGQRKRGHLGTPGNRRSERDREERERGGLG